MLRLHRTPTTCQHDNAIVALYMPTLCWWPQYASDAASHINPPLDDLTLLTSLLGDTETHINLMFIHDTMIRTCDVSTMLRLHRTPATCHHDNAIVALYMPTLCWWPHYASNAASHIDPPLDDLTLLTSLLGDTETHINLMFINDTMITKNRPPNVSFIPLISHMMSAKDVWIAGWVVRISGSVVTW